MYTHIHTHIYIYICIYTYTCMLYNLYYNKPPPGSTSRPSAPAGGGAMDTCGRPNLPYAQPPY